MPHFCAAPGCTADRADLYCPAHRTRLRRYGHPLQRAVTSRDLEPFACRIASRLPADGDVRTILADRWSKLVRVVENTAAGIFRVPFDAASGDRPATGLERDAARRFIATAAETTATEVADIVIGLTILRAVKPETFEDDRAFRFLIARRFLGLSTSNAARHLASRSTTYKTFPSGLMLAVADWLWSAFGEVATRIADKEKKAMEEAEADALGGNLLMVSRLIRGPAERQLAVRYRDGNRLNLRPENLTAERRTTNAKLKERDVLARAV